MKVRELYDHVCALSQDLDITIEDINVCTMIIKEGNFQKDSLEKTNIVKHGMVLMNENPKK